MTTGAFLLHPLDCLSRPICRRPSWGALRAALGAAAVIVALGLGACTTTTTGSVRKVTPIKIDAGRTARLISAYRAEHGQRLVSVDSRLMKVAADYARVMGERDAINHKLGASLPRRTAAAGYDWGYVAENLAASYDSIDGAMGGWKASAGHKKNLLNPLATEIGIAAVATPPGSAHRNYWALVLATPRPKRLVAKTIYIGDVE